jgi:LysR family transcriptional activator of nhaA
MGSLNYHHLLYFWTVARAGSVRQGADSLFVSQPTVSEQIRQLEKSVGGPLFDRVGRRLELTELGQEVLRYADEIFSLGRELEDFLADRPRGEPRRVQIGMVDRLPKIIAYRIIEPALRLKDPVRVECHDGSMDSLLDRLLHHQLDVVLSDAPVHERGRGRIFHHLLGKCGVSFLATSELARPRRRDFPHSLAASPLLLPSKGSPFRQEFQRWCETLGLQVDVRGEFDDSALMKSFAQAGIGIVAVPTAIEKLVGEQYKLHLLGRTDDLVERFFAISMDRRIRHPAVQAMTQTAREEIFK